MLEVFWEGRRGPGSDLGKWAPGATAEERLGKMLQDLEVSLEIILCAFVVFSDAKMLFEIEVDKKEKKCDAEM